MVETEQKNKLIDLLEKHVWSKQGINDIQQKALKLQMSNLTIEQLTKVVQSQMKYMENVNLEEELDSILGKKTNSSTNKEQSNLSSQEIKNLLEQITDKKIEEVYQKLHKSLFKMISNDLPVFNIRVGNNPIKNIGLSHKLYPKLLALAATKTGTGDPLNIWLTGPAGSGKTRAAQNVAKELGLEFYFNGAIDTEYKLLGFIDAQGKVINTSFKKAYTQGGVYLFDEVDASLPGALLAFNAALANGYADFPDGKYDRHPDCIIIAAANTWGTGPNSEYVGRNKLDAAFIDRFVQLAWEYDPALEKALGDCDPWVEYVQALRKNVLTKSIKTVISPRASITGSALLKQGNFTIEEVIDFTLKKGLKEDTWNTITMGVSKEKLNSWHNDYLKNLSKQEQDINDKEENDISSEKTTVRKTKKKV